MKHYFIFKNRNDGTCDDHTIYLADVFKWGNLGTTTAGGFQTALTTFTAATAAAEHKQTESKRQTLSANKEVERTSISV